MSYYNERYFAIRANNNPTNGYISSMVRLNPKARERALNPRPVNYEKIQDNNLLKNFLKPGESIRINPIKGNYVRGAGNISSNTIRDGLKGAGRLDFKTATKKLVGKFIKK